MRETVYLRFRCPNRPLLYFDAGSKSLARFHRERTQVRRIVCEVSDFNLYFLSFFYKMVGVYAFEIPLRCSDAETGDDKTYVTDDRCITNICIYRTVNLVRGNRNNDESVETTQGEAHVLLFERPNHFTRSPVKRYDSPWLNEDCTRSWFGSVHNVNSQLAPLK